MALVCPPEGFESVWWALAPLQQGSPVSVWPDHRSYFLNYFWLTEGVLGLVHPSTQGSWVAGGWVFKKNLVGRFRLGKVPPSGERESIPSILRMTTASAHLQIQTSANHRCGFFLKKVKWSMTAKPGRDDLRFSLANNVVGCSAFQGHLSLGPSKRLIGWC